jgi:orotate phosphoribosyltransferase
MTTSGESKERLLALLKQKSVFHGDFVLASGASSSFYVDCKLTTLDPVGAVLAGEVMFSMIGSFALERGKQINAVGGLTMGADPLALAIGMQSIGSKQAPPLQVFSVRKSPKTHGQNKLIEGNFRAGDHVVVIDDVVTRGESTLKAIDAVEQAGGVVEFVAALVDREEGGRKKIEARGYPVVSVFSRAEVLTVDVAKVQRENLAVA